MSALESDGFIDFIRQLTQEPKDKAVFQDKLKRRPHFCLWLSLAFRIPTDLRRLNEITHLRNDAEKPPKTIALRLGAVEAIEVHHLVPHCHKVIYKFLLRVLRSVDLREGA